MPHQETKKPINFQYDTWVVIRPYGKVWHNQYLCELEKNGRAVYCVNFVHENETFRGRDNWGIWLMNLATGRTHNIAGGPGALTLSGFYDWMVDNDYLPTE